MTDGGGEEVQEDVADDQPDLEDDELADFSSIAEDVEASVEEDLEDEDQEGSPDVEDVESRADLEDVGMGEAGPEVSVGTVYCNSLGMAAAIARAQYGTANSDDREELVDEYSDMAEQLQIDDYVDQWLEEHGGIDQLSPGQAILVSTMLWGSLVVMDDPAILENLGPGEEVVDG